MATERIDIVIRERGGRRVVQRMDQVQGRAQAASTAVRRLQQGLLALGGIQLLRGTIGQLASFGQTLATVRAITGSTDEQFQDLRDVAQELGATTRFSATEAGEGLLFLARAGFSTEAAIDTVDDTLRLAQAGALGLGRAADIATNVLTGFELQSADAGRIVDVLALAANSANTNVEQLGDAIKFVAPVAASFGVSVEEASAAVGTLSNAGLQASLAGTGLRRVLSELEKDSPKLTRILQGTGLAVEDVRPSVVGLNTALENLRQIGLSGSEALNLFGQRGGPAAIALTRNAEAVRELTAELDNAAGTAQRVAEIQDDTLFGSLKAVQAAAEAVLLALGDAGLTGGFERFARTVAEGLRFLSRNIEILQGALTALTVAAIPRAIAALRTLAIVLTTSTFGAVAVFGALVGFVAAFSDNVTLANDRVATLADFFRAAFQIIQESLGPTQAAVENFFTNVLGVIGLNAIDDIEFSIEGLFRFLARGVDRIVRLFTSLGAAFDRAFDQLSDNPETAFRQIFNTFVEIAERAISTIIGLFQSLGDVLLRILATVRNVIQQTASAVAQSLRGNTRAAGLALDAATAAADTLRAQLAASPALFRDSFERNAENLGELNFFEFLKFEVPQGEVADLADTISLAFQEELRARAGQPGPAEAFLDSVLERAENIARERRARQEISRLQQEGAVGGLPTRPTELEELEEQDQPAQSAIQGFQRGFDELAGIVNNFGEQAQATIVNAFGAAEDALVEFVQTGEVNFSQLVDSILSDLTRLLFRQALFGLLGLATGGSQGASGLGSFLFGRQAGGPVTTGRPFIVGERGPELFVPPSNGQIVPNGQAPQPGPMNVTIVNQTSPDEIFETLNTPEGEDVIVNAISRKRRTVREVIQS